MRWLWNTSTLLILVAWTFAIAAVFRANGYSAGVLDERARQTQMLIDLTTLVDERCGR